MEQQLNQLLTKALEATNTTGNQLAEHLNVGRSTITRYLNGSITPPVERWNAIENRLQLYPGAIGEALGYKVRTQPVDHDPRTTAIATRLAALAPSDRHLADALITRLTSDYNTRIDDINERLTAAQQTPRR